MYDIAGLLREYWSWEQRPNMYGAIFKRMVLHGFFPHVRWVGEKSNGQALYQVLPPRITSTGPVPTLGGTTHD